MFIHLLPFTKLDKKSVALAGGKGASLGEMTQAKIPVPVGFVVLASAFDRFLAETDLNVEVESLLKKVNKKDVNSVDRASNEIRDLILKAKFPKDLAKEILKDFAKLKATFVAVRSSATAEDSSTASWAGELESYLNTSKKNLLLNIKNCWSSLFTPRAIFYRIEKGLHKTKVSVAVVIQKMVQSEISGICFTVHPVTKDYDQMIIEAGYGLGEAIVGGMITPDTYVVHKKKKNILDKNISTQEMMIVKHSPRLGEAGQNGNIEKQVPKAKQTKQKISDAQILKLAQICQGIENHYGFPCDIEWAFAKGKFYIVQSRPITTL
jgi:pyruvate,water dikinase